MICPACDGDTHVIETRTTANGIRRRRECSRCGQRVSTINGQLVPPRPAGPQSKRNAYKNAWRNDPAKKQAQKLRTAAREQARQEGVTPEVIYARWQL